MSHGTLICNQVCKEKHLRVSFEGEKTSPSHLILQPSSKMTQVQRFSFGIGFHPCVILTGLELTEIPPSSAVIECVCVLKQRTRERP